MTGLAPTPNHPAGSRPRLPSTPWWRHPFFAKGLAKLDPLPASFEIDLSSFKSGIDACARALAEGRFERPSIPKLSTATSGPRP